MPRNSSPMPKRLRIRGRAFTSLFFEVGVKETHNLLVVGSNPPGPLSHSMTRTPAIPFRQLHHNPLELVPRQFSVALARNFSSFASRFLSCAIVRHNVV